MAIQNQTTDAFECPECDSTLCFTDGAWGCTNCSYVPRQSAD